MVFFFKKHSQPKPSARPSHAQDFWTSSTAEAPPATPDSVTALEGSQTPQDINTKVQLGIRIRRAPATMRATAIETVEISVTNEGGWVSSQGDTPVLIAYHWVQNGEIIVQEGLRTPFPHPLAPGASVDLSIQVAVPDTEGATVLKIVPIHEMVAWFEDQGVPILVDLRR